MENLKIVEKQPHSEKYLRERKMKLVMPLLILPFITLGFWALRGGKGDGKKVPKTDGGALIASLPEAGHFQDSTFDKMQFYEQAQKDSANRLKMMDNDPYYSNRSNDPLLSNQFSAGSDDRITDDHDMPSTSRLSDADQNEKRIREKLAALDHAVNEKGSVKSPKDLPSSVNPAKAGQSVNSSDIDRLESMISSVQGGQSGNDPEMQQIQDVLGKILDIQHPDRVQERLQQASQKNQGQVFAVAAANMDPVTTLDSNQLPVAFGSNGFFGLENDLTSEMNSPVANSILAVISDDQVLVTGAFVKLRLTSDVFINGQLVPKNTFLFGQASVNGERLNVVVTSIRYQNSIFPVRLSVYDIDGLPGLYIPGAISRDVAKESGDRAVQALGMSSLDPSVSAQALSAGIDAAKSLLSKKIKLVKVAVKANYQVFLKDDNQKSKF